MRQKPEPVAAWTRNPNTPQTDQDPEVLCVVLLSDMRSLEIMAASPDVAIEKARRWLQDCRKN